MLAFTSHAAPSLPGTGNGSIAWYSERSRRASSTSSAALVLSKEQTWRRSLGGFKRPGFVTGVFLIWYGWSRFLVEYFRVPDPQFFSSSNIYGFAFNFGDFGLTMGQALSLPMVLVGLSLLLTSLRYKK